MTTARKLLITGGAGFIGCALVQRLLDGGHQVVVLDNLKRSSETVSRRLESAGARVITGDIRDYDTVLAAARGCDAVFHLAAQSNVMGAIEDPNYSVTTNVFGTFNVLRASAEANVGRVVFASSREVYGEAATLPVREDHPLLAKNPYGASKVAGEAYCRTFANTHGLPVSIVRLANVYGPGDSGRVIPLWLTAAQQGQDIQVYGGEQVIDFLWVGTVVEALLYAEANHLPQPVNIGSGRGTKIMELASRVVEVTKSEVEIVRTSAREIEVAKFVADTSLMRSLGLVPESDPLLHLAELVDAYRP